MITDDPFAATVETDDDASIVEHDDQILYGSNTLPATFEIDGETVTLGVIVAAAFTASGLTEDEWNKLSDADRDAKLQAELDKRGYVAPTEEITPAPESDKPAEEPVQADDLTEAPEPIAETAPVAEPAAAPDDLVIDTHAQEPAHPLEDAPVGDDVLSAAPPRLHQSLVDQLSLRWHEVKEFVSRLEGETGMSELDNVLDMARHYLRG